jgi:phosphatidate cytidylyltransferase
LTFDLFAPVECDIDPVFISHPYALPFEIFGWQPVIWFKEATFHILVYTVAASFLAPFGGFLASGLKRAINVKNFGTIFPGHGGMMDRLDCKVVIAAFSFFYLRHVVYRSQFLVEDCYSIAKTMDSEQITSAI